MFGRKAKRITALTFDKQELQSYNAALEGQISKLENESAGLRGEVSRLTEYLDAEKAISKEAVEQFAKTSRELDKTIEDQTTSLDDAEKALQEAADALEEGLMDYRALQNRYELLESVLRQLNIPVKLPAKKK